MLDSIANSLRASHQVFAALGVFVALNAFASAQESPIPTPNRSLIVEGTLLEPIAGMATQGNAGLFIGINDFTKDASLSRLQFAVNDSVELAYLFVFELKLIPAKNCTLLLSGTPAGTSVERHLEQLRSAEAVVSTADRTEILSRLEKLRSIPAKDSNLLVCSVSSHGFIVDGRPYVMPSDGLKSRLKYTAVELDLVEDDMEQSKAGNRLLFVDACQERVAAKAIGAAVVGQGMDAAFKQAFEKATGQYKLASCSPKQLSYEFAALGNVGHGVFTFALLEALRGGAAADGENLVRLKSVEDFVSKYLANWSRDKNVPTQTPFAAGAMTSREFPLARRAGDLATLIASIQRQPVAGVFTVELRDRLVAALKKLDLGQESDRELVSLTRNFVNGMLPVNAFVPYLRLELDRRQPSSSPPLLMSPFSVVEARSSQQAWAAHLGKPVNLSVSLNERVKMTFALIPPGEFLMGASKNDAYADEIERPQHRVRITKPFYLGVYELTQAEWQAVTNEPRPLKGDSYVRVGGDYPVSGHWNTGVDFCRRLSELQTEKAASREYRLPTEAEWEYACRSGSTTRYSFGDEEGALGDYAWYGKNAYELGEEERHAHRVGQKRPNAFGLYDMHGNVSEWCHDFLWRGYFPPAIVGQPIPATSTLSTLIDPKGPTSGVPHVLRGGSWAHHSSNCRSSSRHDPVPSLIWGDWGYRLALSVDSPPAQESKSAP